MNDEFESVIATMIRDAVSFIDEEVSPQRAKAMRFYRGDKFGDEQDGRSQVVSRDVHDVIQSVLPSIYRTFFGGERLVDFVGRGPEDVQSAEQASDYINYLLENDDFYEKFRSIAMDALLHGDGFGKVYYEEEEEVSIKQFTGLGEMELMALMQEDGELEYSQRDDGFFDAVVKKTETEREICVEAIAPEEFLIDRRATCIDDAELVAHRCHLTVNELVEMGYDRDEMMELTGDNELMTNSELVERQWNFDISESANDGFKRVLYVEAYTEYDLDGDGLAEKVKVCTGGVGYKVLKVEPVDECPFFKLAMSPNAHSFFSEGMYDRLHDVQRINSQVMRLTLDSLAQTIFPRMKAVEGDANIEDLLNNEIGAIVRVRTLGGADPMVTPFAGQAAFPVLDYMRQVKEQRSGISGASMGVNADMLTNATREAVAATISAGQGQIEMICRNFAAGLKRMYALMLEMIKQHQDQPKIIRLRNQYVPIDPRSWGKMDIIINNPMAAGTQQERLAMLQYQFEKQSEAYSALGPQNGVVTLGQIRNTMAKIAEMAGFKDSSEFWIPVPPDFDAEPQDPAADPNAQAAQALAEAEQMKAQLQFQSAQMKAEMDLMAKREKLQSDEQQLLVKLQLEQERINIQREKMILDLELQRAKLLQQMAKDEREAINQAYQQQQVEVEGTETAQEASAMAAAVTALGQMIANLQGGQMAIADGVTAPKQVIRDETGRIVGVQTVTE